MTLRTIVKPKRLEQQLTQTQLAELVGVTRQTIAFIEKGDFSPSIALALRLARALNTPINELFWLEGEQS